MCTHTHEVGGGGGGISFHTGGSEHTGINTLHAEPINWLLRFNLIDLRSN